MEPNQGDILRRSPAVCQGYPGVIFPAEGVGPLLGLILVLGALVSVALPFREKGMAKMTQFYPRHHIGRKRSRGQQKEKFMGH
ncbi:hypothetical protein PoB_004577700 [Plakobranchus ocellatus]|uniref:Uncharacterized protein n=1 Tax=Plakobranchus ocellatus TaxID=259542 RepID=A0AAV4BIQ2_9GAST|nr:hypothetical protein PoB_004577700 [Plakobranchus ocellatus]